MVLWSRQIYRRSQHRKRSTSSTANSSMRSEPLPPKHRVNAHHVVAHYVLAMSTQSSHISKRYYKSRIPKSSNTRGCNNVRLDPQYRCTKTNRPQMPGLARTANGGDATVAVIAAAATHAPHIPGAMRIAVRDAGCRLARLQNGGIPQSDHIIMMMARRPPVQVGMNRTAS